MLWFVCFFNYADRQAIFSLFSLLKAEFGLSDMQLGIVASIFMWVYAIVGPFAGWISDKVSRTGIIITALAFWSAVTAMTMWVQSYPVLVLLRGLAGLSEAFYFPAAMSLIASYHGPETRSRAMSIHQSSVYAGTVAGGFFSAYVAQRAGWRSSFEVFGMSGIVLALALLLFLRDPPRSSAPMHEPDGRGGFLADLTALGKNRAVLLMIAVFMGANFVAVVFLTWMPTFLQRKFLMDLGAAALNGTAYLQVTSVIGVLVGGLLADLACRTKTGGRQLVQCVGLLGGAPFLILTGYSLNVPVLLISLVGFGLFKGLYDANIWASLYDFVSPERRGFAAGLMNSLGWLGGGFAPIVVARLSSHYGLSLCLSLTSVIYLTLGGCMGLLYLRRSGRHCSR
jgi:MFS family permease